MSSLVYSLLFFLCSTHLRCYQHHSSLSCVLSDPAQKHKAINDTTYCFVLFDLTPTAAILICSCFWCCSTQLRRYFKATSILICLLFAVGLVPTHRRRLLKATIKMMRRSDNLSVTEQMEDLRERMRLLQGDRKVRYIPT